ncbi:unannotated protein [freshwater metagenome]|uniref:Unannotated protein n=1 Tax=freshwater metagenome TaxID=449393 RepID=A0A6J7J5E8_9ZZZZ
MPLPVFVIARSGVLTVAVAVDCAVRAVPRLWEAKLAVAVFVMTVPDATAGLGPPTRTSKVTA